MEILTALIIGHFVGDFILQSNWMALNKSKSFWALGCHVAAYSLGLFLVLFATFWGWAAFPEWVYRNLIRFIVVNAGAHFVVDAITSTITSKLWFVQEISSTIAENGKPPITSSSVYYDARKRHWFFVVIGLDQAIHMLILVWLTFYYFY